MPLHSYLHTEECNSKITTYKQCFQDHWYMKYFGFCDRHRKALDSCLRIERELNRKYNSKDNRDAYDRMIKKELEGQVEKKLNSDAKKT